MAVAGPLCPGQLPVIVVSSGSEITRTEAGLRAELGLASEAVASDKPRTWSCSPLPGQTSDSEPGVMIRDKCCDAA